MLPVGGPGLEDRRKGRELADNVRAIAGASATAQVVDATCLFGYQHEQGEPDPRPFPETADLEAMLPGILSAFIDPLVDTALEPDLAEVLWSLTDLFHRKADRVQRQLDDNEHRQRDAQAQQDVSKIPSVELERLIEQGRATPRAACRVRTPARRRRRGTTNPTPAWPDVRAPAPWSTTSN